MYTYRYQHGDRPLDGYTIQRAAGRGGFGEVYYAISDSGREVALKAVQGYEDIELRGISQCMNLKNPHLVSIFDVRHNTDGAPFVIMEFVNGPSLRQLLDESPSGLGEQKSAFFLREIAKGLTYLHDCGIVHRDLKPANIFYENGYVKIGDYGLSKAISSSAHSNQTVTVGTVHYMAPEIGAGKYDRSIDIYALGACLYEMITGTVPFIGASPAEILMKHLAAEPDVRNISEPFATVIKKGMAKDPAQRYQSVQELVEGVFGAEHIRQSMSVFSPDALSMVAARVATKAAVGAAVGAAAGAGSSTVAAQQSRERWNGAGLLADGTRGGSSRGVRTVESVSPSDPVVLADDPWSPGRRVIAAGIVSAAAALVGANLESSDKFAGFILFTVWVGVGILLAVNPVASVPLAVKKKPWWSTGTGIGVMIAAGVALLLVAGLFFARVSHAPMAQPFVVSPEVPMARSWSSQNHVEVRTQQLLPVWNNSNNSWGSFGWTWVAVAVPFIFGQSGARNTQRRKRILPDKVFGVTVFAWIISAFLFHSERVWFAPLCVAAICVMLQYLTPWTPAVSTGGFSRSTSLRATPDSFDQVFDTAFAGAATPGYRQPQSPAGPSRMVVPPPLPPAARVGPLPQVPAVARTLWLFVMLFSLPAAIALFVAANDPNIREPAVPVVLGIGLLLMALFSLIRIFTRQFRGWWRYLIRPLCLWVSVQAIIGFGIASANESLNYAQTSIMVFWIVFFSLSFVVLLCIPGGKRVEA